MPNKSNEILIRLRGKKSREEVAEALHISARTLASYERGERVPRDGVKRRIAEYYGRTVNYIFFSNSTHES